MTKTIFDHLTGPPTRRQLNCELEIDLLSDVAKEMILDNLERKTRKQKRVTFTSIIRRALGDYLESRKRPALSQRIEEIRNAKAREDHR